VQLRGEEVLVKAATAGREGKVEEGRGFPKESRAEKGFVNEIATFQEILTAMPVLYNVVNAK